MMKPIKIMAVLLALCISCTGAALADESAAPEGIKILLGSTQMRPGETQKIRYMITPANAEGYELEYTSSAAEVVTAAIGAVIANREGTADITIKVKGTDISDTATVTVTGSDQPSPVLVTDILLGVARFDLERYDERQITYELVPKDASNKKLIFTSLAPAVATVSDTGLVYGRRAGTAEIRVQSADGNIDKHVTVTVYDDSYAYDYSGSSEAVSVRRVDIYDGEAEVVKTVEIMRAQSKQFSARIYPENAADKRIRWRSSDDTVAEVDENGIVTGISEGTAKVYAVSRDSGRQDVITVKIIPFVRRPDSISIAPEEGAVYETGQTVKFSAMLLPADTTEKNITWFVYGGDATIDDAGVVTITDRGTITVRAYTEGGKLSASYEFEAAYSENHFTQFAEAHNVSAYRFVCIDFDGEVSPASVRSNIFAAAEPTGNTDLIDVTVSVDGRRVTVTPVNGWGRNAYIFIKGSVRDVYGNPLRKCLKYKLSNIRGMKENGV